MSYAKAIRVVDAISTRYADTRIRVALAEVKAVIEALDAVSRMPGGGVPEPIEATLARADPKRLPPLAPQAPRPELTTARSVAGIKRWQKHAWPREVIEEIFDYLGEGHQIRAAEVKFEKPYASIRKQCLRFPEDPRLQHLTVLQRKPVDV